ncbi:MAG TPA: uroporphyrinogen-III synthase [Mycobacteriales bacterium]|nr:uroporphyrinogen-III synthase [Mycobacteriales bacterium]
MASKKKAYRPLAVVGTGPGDAALLTVRAVEQLANAEVVAGPAALLTAYARHFASGAELRPDCPPAEIVAEVRAGRAVTLLVGGDPLSEPAGAALVLTYAKALHRARLAWELVPAIPSVTAVGAYAGLALAASGVSTVAHIEAEGDWAALAAAPGTLALSLPSALAGKAAAALTEHGRRGDEAASFTVGGTTTAQRTVVGTLDTLGDHVEAGGLSGPGLLVAGAALADRDRLSWWESRPLFGWTVLVPRTRAQAGETSALLRSYGAEPLEVPTIAVEPPRTPAPMERAIKGLVSGRYAWVAFTSTNAVRAVLEKLAEFGLDSRAFAGVKLAAVGTATAQSLADAGLRADLLPAGEQSSEGLLVDFPEHDELFDPLDRVFLPRADIATEILVAGLKDRGWAVDDVTAYRTVRAAPPPAPVREAIKGGRVDAALFTSSSTVRNLVGIAGKPHERTIIACIGPQTAQTARELGLRVDVQPKEATVSSLAAALAEFAVARRAEQALTAGSQPAVPAAKRKPAKR